MSSKYVTGQLVQFVSFWVCCDLLRGLLLPGPVRITAMLVLFVLYLLGDDIQFHFIEKKTHHEDEI